jgi:excisionase family DNA binding protein
VSINSPILLAVPTEGLHDIRDPLPTQPAVTPAPLLVDSREAAKLLAVSERTLWGLTAAGKLPCVRLGRRVKRYALSDLEEFVARLRTREG